MFEVAKANPIFDVPPIYDRPVVAISPINGTAQRNQTVIFNVEMPATWWYVKSSPTAEGRYVTYVGTIRNVTCILDDNLLMFNGTGFGRVENSPQINYLSATDIIYSQDAGVLPLGLHNITVTVEADVFSRIIGSYNERYTNVSTTATYLFVISSIPTIALSLNATYEQSIVPLVFSVDQNISWLGYSIDNQANVTISENFTLTAYRRQP